ncbi:alpha/beta fold hydrolase [Sphingosinicella sp. YJ22]|uniref:alpha/beta fold hydrolase n=1 Tax=Sphingosinicella sp. YJ22 TaxID=1104780 RepID=UPI00140D9FDB|nr:alpha/beta fold hydrolase [Sphingosinicella sp. YJ22]
MADIFLSYAREDVDAARALAAGLEGLGCSVWWDRKIRGGTEFSSEIEEALGAAGAIIVLWSKSSLRSHWVRDEAAFGRDTGKLIPVTIDRSDPPLGFRQFHTLNLTTLNGVDGADLPSELKAAIDLKLGRAGQSSVIGRAPELDQEIRFCTASDGTGLAYSVIGEGPPLVKSANWMNHLEFEWGSPIWSHWIRELARGRTLLRYDERGNGMSDRNPASLTFDDFVEDLETVTDAAGMEQFDLLGISQGASVAVAYAVRHPDRVKRLILYSGFPVGAFASGDEDRRAQEQAMITLVSSGWGGEGPAFRQLFTNIFFPHGTAEEIAWFNELQKVSATAAQAQRIMEVIATIDVRDLLPMVSVPTLVVHGREDQAVPVEIAHKMAASIPDARFATLETKNHILTEHEPAWGKFQQQLRAFLTNDGVTGG